MTDDKKSDKAGETGGRTHAHPVHKVIQAFGGIRPMAHKLGIAVSTVQGWKNRDAIPDSRHSDILDAAKKHGINLDPDLLKASGDGEGTDAAPTVEAEAEPVVEDADVVAGEGQNAQTGTATESATETATAADAATNTDATATKDATAEPSDAQADTAPEDETVPPRPHVIERPRPTGWVPGLLLGAAVLALGAGSTVVLRDHWLPLIQGEQAMPDPVAQKFERVDDRLVALSNRLNRSAEVESLENVRATVSDLASQVADIEDRIGDLQLGGGKIDSEALSGVTERQDKLAARIDDVADRIDTMSARLDGIGKRVDTLAETTVNTEQLATLRTRVGELSGQFNSLASAADLEKTRNAAATAARQAAAQELGQAMAVVQLRDALRESTPYATTLTAARARLPQTPPVTGALETLAAHAERGVPTRDALATDFQKRAGRAVAVSAGDGDGGMLTGVLRRLGDVVQVRPVGGDQAGSTAGATLARAEARLSERNLDTAIAEVANLSGPAAETMAPWLADAKARLAVEKALETLRTAVIASDSVTDSAPGSTSGENASGDNGDGA